MRDDLTALWAGAEEHLQPFKLYARRTVEETWLAGLEERRMVAFARRGKEVMWFRTGEVCRLSAVYRPRCHPGLEIELDEGAVFPLCRAGAREHGTAWILVRRT